MAPPSPTVLLAVNVEPDTLEGALPDQSALSMAPRRRGRRRYPKRCTGTRQGTVPLSALSTAPARPATLPQNVTGQCEDPLPRVPAVDGPAVPVYRAIAGESGPRHHDRTLTPYIPIGDGTSVAINGRIRRERGTYHDERAGASGVRIVDSPPLALA